MVCFGTLINEAKTKQGRTFGPKPARWGLERVVQRSTADEEHPSFPSDEAVIVASFSTLMEANLAMARLRARGIRSMLVGEDAPYTRAPMDGYEIRVLGKHARHAHAILAALDKHPHQRPERHPKA